MEERSARKRDLTVGSPFKKIILFSLPLMLSNVLQVLFNISDVAVVGKFGSSNALGSVGSTTIYVALFTGILIGMGSGVNALVARRIGACDEEGVARASHTCAVICVAFGVLTCGLGCALAKPLLMLLGTKEELLAGAQTYVYIYFAGLPAMAFYNFGNGVFSADGDTKRPLVFLLISGILNVGLNLLFVIVCKMTVEGVALASIISQYLSAVLVCVALIRTRRPYRLRFSQLKVGKSETKALLRLGLPAGLQNAIFSIANLFIQSGVNSFDTVMVNGNSAAANADGIVYDVMAALYTACTSFISQNFGAGKRQNILKCYFVSLLYSFVVGAVLGISLFFGGRIFLSLFTSETEVIEAGMERLSVLGLAYALSAFMDCALAACRGIGKTLVPTIIVILGSCVFRVAWIYTVFSAYHTMTGLYLLYPVSWTITAIAENICFAVYYRRLCRPRRAKPSEQNQ